MPTTPGGTANGSFYFLKVDKGLLIADRIVQANISAQALNAKNYLQGHMQGRSVFRCLSQSEWTKYLTNGDCGGCITKRDNNVWHSVNKGVTNLANNVDRNIQQFIANQYVEILQDVKNNKVRISMLLSGATYNNTYLMRFYSNGEDFGREDYLPLENDFSTALIFINHVKRADRYSRFYNYFSFRPAMEYIDNPNSKNIWY